MITQFRGGSLPKSIRATGVTLYTSTKCLLRRNNCRRVGLLILRGILLLPLLAFGRTPFERLEEKHLVAVHEQRIEWMKKRAVLEPLGVYQDYRAIFTSES